MRGYCDNCGGYNSINQSKDNQNIRLCGNCQQDTPAATPTELATKKEEG